MPLLFVVFYNTLCFGQTIHTHTVKKHNTHTHNRILVDLVVKVNPTLLCVLMVFQGLG